MTRSRSMPWDYDLVEDFLVAAMPAIRRRVTEEMATPAENGRRRIERHFHRIVVDAIREAATWVAAREGFRAEGLELSSVTVPIPGFRHEGREPGPVDILLPQASAPGAVELKWCWEAETFANCAWDLLKLGSALHAGSIGRGYLLVGGIPNAFAAGAAGSEPFTSTVWRASTRDLLTDPRLASYFRLWRGDVIARPRRVPAGIETNLLVLSGPDTGGGRFRVALASVRVIDPAVIEIDGDGRVQE